MPKLTKKVVDAATPRAGQFYVWDGEMKGFGLRVTPAGAKSYILNYRDVAGRSRRYTIGKHGSPWTCDEARTKAIELLRGLAAGIDPLNRINDAMAAAIRLLMLTACRKSEITGLKWAWVDVERSCLRLADPSRWWGTLMR